jgi:RES domain-containing protein
VVDEDLIARVNELGVSALSEVTLRHVSPGTDPRSGTGARVHGGRWNPPDSFQTLYFGLSRETVVAEFQRAARRQGLQPEDFLPRELHTFRISLAAVLDLRSEERLAQVSLTLLDVERPDAHSCQLIGDAAHYLGSEGILAPSATRIGTVLAVFLDRLKPGSIVESIAHEVWEELPRSD